MATTSERIGIVETKVENINEKIDDLNVNVREMHDCLDKTREDLTKQLEKMYNASCEQHAALGKEISELKKIKDKWTRLWNEADYSIEVAEWLTQKVKVIVEIDLDYNSQEKHFSSKLVPPVVGWATSLGYKTNIKPDNQIATKAADHHCR